MYFSYFNYKPSIHILNFNLSHFCQCFPRSQDLITTVSHNHCTKCTADKATDNPQSYRMHNGKELKSPSLINIPSSHLQQYILPDCEWQHSAGRYISLFSCQNILMCHQSGSSFLAQRNTKPEPNTVTRSLSEG